MKGKLKAAALVAVFTVLLGGCSAADTTEYKRDITVIQVEPAAVSYTQETKTEAAQSLLNALTEAVTAAYGGQSAKTVEGLYDYVLQAVECFESRNLSQSKFLSLTQTLCENADFIVGLYAENSDADSLAAAELFGNIAGVAGTDTACYVAYDLALIYCGYWYDKYTELYEKYAYPYQLTYAGQWRERYNGIAAIGEENFKYLLKVAVSAASAYSGNGETFDKLLDSSGEAALYLRAQGYMTEKLTLTADDWNFVFNVLADGGFSAKLKALCSAGAAESLSQNFAAFVNNLAYALTQVDGDCAQKALDGDVSAFLKALLSVWSDEQWNDFIAVISAAQDGTEYEAYFIKAGVYADFEAFCGGVSLVTLQQLRESSEDDFYAALKNFVAGYSAGIAFIIFEL